MKYLYEVVETESQDFPKGKRFWTSEKFGRGKIKEISDKNGNDVFLKRIDKEKQERMK